MRKRKKIKYTDEPIGKIRVVSDFLPRTDSLVLKEDIKKVKSNLSNGRIT
jgi:hypothetical protein